MKRTITALVSCALLFTLSACSGGTDGENTTQSSMTSKPTTEVTSETTTETTSETTENTTEAQTSESVSEVIDANETVVLLQSIWDTFPEEAAFPSAGGDMEHSVMGGAGMVAVDNTDYISNILLFPANFAGKIVEAASLGHMMNSNNLTSGLYRLDESTDLAAVTSAFEEKLEGNQWLCGFPEKYLVMQVDDSRVFLAYGFADNIQAMKDHITSQIAAASVLAEGDIL